MRLDHRTMEVRRGSPAGAQQDSGNSGRQADPECGEGGGPLVEEHMNVDIGALGEGDRHRRAARAGGHDRLAQPVTDPLVDQRRAERRLNVLRRRGHDRHDRRLSSRRAPPRRRRDLVCPWCYIGKRRFETAVSELAGEIDVSVVFRPYQLDPTASPGKAGPVLDAYAKKFGGYERAQQIIDHVTSVAAESGIHFRMDRALRANTLRAHRLLWLATATGKQVDLKERLLQAYFIDGLDVGDPEVLATCAAEVGLDHDRVLLFLDSDDGLAEVRHELQAALEMDITAVPTFVFDGKWMVPGAQDPGTFVEVLRRVVAKRTANV
jgi:predicted DsbA family dithiol-disulfide isomerase